MTVRSYDDINVKVVGPKGHPFLGKFILFPNAIRRDIRFSLTPTARVTPQPKPFTGKDLEAYAKKGVV